MGTKEFSFELSSGGAEKVVKQIQEYINTLNDKMDRFVRNLAELGLPIIDDRMSMAKGDFSGNYLSYIKLHAFGNYSEATLVLEGKEILFVEFGAGIHFNGSTSPNPYSGKFGYQIGSYGKGNGLKDYWYYYDDDGEKHRSHGTQATMPMYKSYETICNEFIRLAELTFMG